MKAVIRDNSGNVIATARKKETEAVFPDYIEKADPGAIGRALAMCGYKTIQAPEFDEQDRLADAPGEKKTQTKSLASKLVPPQAHKEGSMKETGKLQTTCEKIIQ